MLLGKILEVVPFGKRLKGSNNPEKGLFLWRWDIH